MRFDTVKRYYVSDTEAIISPAEVRREVSHYIAGEKEKTERQARQLLDGAISLASFFTQMKTRIETWHEVAGSIAYGGKAQIDNERQARINAKINSELTYLREFQKQAKASFAAARSIAKSVVSNLRVGPLKEFPAEVTPAMRAQIERELYQALIKTAPSDADPATRKIVDRLLRDAGLLSESLGVDEKLAADLMGSTIPSRAGLYANAAYSTYQNNEIARESDAGITLGRRVCPEDDASCEECVAAADTYFVALNELPEIGSLTCMNNCRCYFEYAEPQAAVGLTVDRSQQADAVQ